MICVTAEGIDLLYLLFGNLVIVVIIVFCSTVDCSTVDHLRIGRQTVLLGCHGCGVEWVVVAGF